MVTVLCPVRGCGLPLARREGAWVCPRGHAHDVARSGYCNLLQPQDRRSSHPGDPREAVQARHRFLEAGHGGFLLEALREELARLPLPPGPAVLDVGCGEGYFLASLARGWEMEAHGVDLSLPAVDLAARRRPEAAWWVVNADRLLPFAEGSFDLALSVAARRPAAELHRVLKPDARLLVAVPGEDDLVELRQAVLGEGRLRGRMERTSAELAEGFELEARRSVRQVEVLDREALRDALASTYRGARHSRAERLAQLGELEVTLSFELGRFRRVPGGAE